MSKPHFWKHTYLQLRPLAHEIEQGILFQTIWVSTMLRSLKVICYLSSKKKMVIPPMFMALICPLQAIPDDGGMAMPICHHLDGAKIF